MTRCNIFNFLRAHGEESSRGRTLEGGGIFLEEEITVSRLSCAGFEDWFPQR